MISAGEAGVVSEEATPKAKTRLVVRRNAIKKLDEPSDVRLDRGAPAWQGDDFSTSTNASDEDLDLPALCQLASRLMTSVGRELFRTFYGATNPQWWSYLDDTVTVNAGEEGAGTRRCARDGRALPLGNHHARKDRTPEHR